MEGRSCLGNASESNASALFIGCLTTVDSGASLVKGKQQPHDTGAEFWIGVPILSRRKGKQALTPTDTYNAVRA